MLIIKVIKTIKDIKFINDEIMSADPSVYLFVDHSIDLYVYLSVYMSVDL